VTVARRIAALEEAFGEKVMGWTAGGWDATPLGWRALDAAQRVNDVLLQHTADPREPAIDDVVRLSATDTFSTHVAAPAAARASTADIPGSASR
jgi:DNA-binding transcriptional LysR family regulator